MYPCKETTDIVVNYTSNLVNNTQIPDTISPWILVSLHILLIFFIVYKLLTNPINNYYYIYLTVWILIILSNYYFHGCILTRIERNLMNNKEWMGPITLLRHINIPITKDTVNMYIKILSTIVCIGILLKLIKNNKYILFSILLFLFTPLLFFKTQSLVEYDSMITNPG